MGDKTGIEWTDATWNPIVGCSVVSPGCTNCYAMKMAARLECMGTAPHYAGTTKASKAGPVWTGKMVLAPEHILTAPLRWRRPRRIFVNSMGDLFHKDVPDAWIDKVFAVMALAPQHTFQVLTKRSARMRAYVSSGGKEGAANRVRYSVGGGVGIRDNWQWPLRNVWLGVSAEDQRRADERVPDLLSTPAAVRFSSAEPLLGPIDFNDIPWPVDRPRFPETDDISDGRTALRVIEGTRLDWIIVGGESGPRARPMHPQWARDIRDACAAAGVTFHHKQNGEWASVSEVEGPGEHFTFPDGATVRRVGKARAGRMLDGVEHNGMPLAAHAHVTA